MKKIIVILSLFLFFSCSKNLESLNKDPKNATSASGEAFFNMASKNMTDEVNNITYGSGGSPFETTRLIVQQISSVTYNEGTTYYSNFNWSDVYMGVLKNLDESANMVEATAPIGAAGATRKKNQLALIEIMKVYAYEYLVVAFGDIPYSEALDFTNVLPKYDDDQVIYVDLLKRLSAAITSLDASGKSFDSDIIYNGDVAKWKKFANSLKLKMGMRIIDKDATLGASTVTAAAPNVFTSNADNAIFKYLAVAPNTNSLWPNLAIGNRKDFVAAKPFVDLMNTLKDPRRPVFFTNVGGDFVGAPSGAVVTYESFSRFSDAYYQPTLPAIIMDYATVQFLLAEAAERNIIGTPAAAESHYNAAITASMNYYGVGSAAAAYLAQPGVAYATAGTNWKQKIGTQKWLALFNQGPEAWTEYRRLDYPVLSAPPGSYINVVPRRLTYPISEQTLNGANYKAAAAAVGSDLMTTKLFWDVY
jgi:hypothetical protein